MVIIWMSQAQVHFMCGQKDRSLSGKGGQPSYMSRFWLMVDCYFHPWDSIALYIASFTASLTPFQYSAFHTAVDLATLIVTNDMKNNPGHDGTISSILLQGLFLKNWMTLATSHFILPSSTLITGSLKHHPSLLVAWMNRYWFESLPSLTLHAHNR